MPEQNPADFLRFVSLPFPASFSRLSIYCEICVSLNWKEVNRTMNIETVALEDVLQLRHEVMWPNKPLEFVKVPKDEQALHLGITEDGSLISVLSLFDEEDSMQFRKFCTREDKQNQGYGSALLKEAIHLAKDKRYKSLWCDARAGKTDFYAKLGFVQEGGPYEKYGKPYVKMVFDCTKESL